MSGLFDDHLLYHLLGYIYIYYIYPFHLVITLVLIDDIIWMIQNY